MGELAERFMRHAANVDPRRYEVRELVDVGQFDSEKRALYAAISELEQRVERHATGNWTDIAAMPLDNGRHDDGWRRRLLDAEASALAAEQRADALLAAVSKLVQTDGPRRCVGFARVVEVGDRMHDGEWHTTLTVRFGGMPLEIITAGGSVAILTSSASDPLNPDLLERASVEFAEEYIRVKAGQERKETA